MAEKISKEEFQVGWEISPTSVLKVQIRLQNLHLTPLSLFVVRFHNTKSKKSDIFIILSHERLFKEGGAGKTKIKKKKKNGENKLKKLKTA